MKYHLTLAVLVASVVVAATAAAVVMIPDDVSITATPGGGPPPPPPNPALEKLEQMYGKMLNDTCAMVVPHIPTLPSASVATFMDAYRAYNGSNSEAAVLASAKTLLSSPGVQTFLAKDWAGDALDTAMVKCAVLFAATPDGLAEFAVVGRTQQDLVSAMLDDTLTMRDMLVAGGPVGGTAYAQAYAILQTLYATSKVLPTIPKPPVTPWDDRNQTRMLRRLALGTALGNAVPIKHRYEPVTHPNTTYVDPVARYMHYESHYLAGDLDPAMEVLTAFECRWTTNCDASDDDLEWLRLTMGNYRPEHIAMDDYSWRYAESVHTDVAYGDPACADLPGICTGTYAQIPAAGGECGPRAFFGRFTRKAFGLPTFGVTQPGHAAMTTWAPDGWRVLLGAAWSYSWWNTRGGDDFYLETQCRELRPDYQKVLRGMWAADALGEAPYNPAWTPRSPNTYGQGGVWNALMLYAKKVAVNETVAPTRPIGPSVVPTKVASLIQRWPTPVPTPNVTTDSAGNIHIPGPAFSWTNNSNSVSVMKSWQAGEQLLYHAGSYADPASTSISFEVTVKEACTRYLTVNHTTWHMNTDLLLTTNTTASKPPVNVPVYYTVGWWNQTQPIAVDLVAGKNVLTFSRSTAFDIAIKEFFMYVNKPNIPPPNANHTTKPVPKPSSYIEVPATTTCTKQGITDVPEQYCQMACEAVGLKYTGAKPRTNMTGCFALTSGQWSGNCNYNSNSSATICSDMPCTIFGSVAQQLCLRQ